MKITVKKSIKYLFRYSAADRFHQAREDEANKVDDKGNISYAFFAHSQRIENVHGKVDLRQVDEESGRHVQTTNL